MSCISPTSNNVAILYRFVKPNKCNNHCSRKYNEGLIQRMEYKYRYLKLRGCLLGRSLPAQDYGIFAGLIELLDPKHQWNVWMCADSLPTYKLIYVYFQFSGCNLALSTFSISVILYSNKPHWIADFQKSFAYRWINWLINACFGFHFRFGRKVFS